MKKNLGLLFTLVLHFGLIAQPALEGWRVHLPYQRNNSITSVGNKIYCGSVSGLFSFQTEDGSIERLSKLNGLSDVEVKLVRHNSLQNCTVVIYQNTNIDIIDHQQNIIYNIPDILQKSIIGSKKINQLWFYEDKVYLACSFGIVVLDIKKKQVIDSYQNLGPGGTQLEFLSVCIFKNRIIACSEKGVYSASLEAPNLNDFNFWININLTKSSMCAAFKGFLYVVMDSILSYSFDSYSYVPYTQALGMKINMLHYENNKLYTIAPDKILIESSDGSLVTSTYSYRNDVVLDSRGFLSMVDNLYGLTIDRPDLGPGNVDFYIPNGPFSKTFGKMLYANGKLWVPGGSVNERWDPLVYNSSKFYTYSNNHWFNYNDQNNPLIKDVADFIDIKKNPFGNDFYISSYGKGVFKIENDAVVKLFNESNSTLQHLEVLDTNYKPLLSGGMDFDNNGNLWVSNYGVSKPLSVKTQTDIWYSFNIGTLIGGTGGNELGWLVCDDYNNKWVTTLRDHGILIYNDNGTPANVNDDNYKMLTKETGQGALPSNSVLSIAKDLKGEMWIGTTQGLTILSNPGVIFNTKNINYDARQIIIKVGSNYEIFLGKEQINCIKVDPANRKWLGTPNGAWLVSEDGYTVIKNFTVSNSPLLSNNVLEIGIDESNGEVFFGTEKGIISYMNDATAGGNTFGKVEIYPNPVRPDFTGQISVRGLAQNAIVKFTDIAGNLVYETTANGGFATWNGNGFNGKRVGTGVYLIFAAKIDKNENNDNQVGDSYVGKLLFIN